MCTARRALPAKFFLFSAAGCGADESSGAVPGGDAPPPDGPPAIPVQPPGSLDPAKVDASSVAFTHLLAGYVGPHRGHDVRGRHRSLRHHRALPAAASDRSFNRAAKTWSKLGALPKPLAWVVLRASAGTEVLALGRRVSDPEQRLAPIVAVDLATKKTRELAAEGDAPKRLWAMAPFGSCLIGYESGDTVDNTVPNLWRCKRDGDVIRWEKTAIDANDYALGGGFTDLLGAGSSDGTRAYFVGSNLWAAVSKQN
jgi:hypothetical protein